MRYLLTGVETNNKGAELMLYAILQEIERHDPNGLVYIERRNLIQGIKYIKSNVKLVILERKVEKLVNSIRINGIFRRLHLPTISFGCENIPQIDYVLDGSGLHFTDQMTRKELLPYWQHIFTSAKRYGAKIIFLPQGFGPIEKDVTKGAIKLLSKFADLIYARDRMSYDFLNNCSVADMSKVKISTDFTALVDGTLPRKYEYLIGGVCIVPNMQMVNKNILTKDAYLEYLGKVINVCKESKRRIYLLNHEGKADESVLEACKQRFKDSIDVVTGLNALEVKGLISCAYIVITSRFHGLASALNSCVPVLSTSWSHKYKCLYEDYKQQNGVLSLSDFSKDAQMIRNILDKHQNKEIRNRIEKVIPIIRMNIQEMWTTVWEV